MDPLSLVASIAGLVTLADVAVTRGMKYCRSVRAAPKEMAEIMEEAFALSGVLSTLKRLLEHNQITEMGKSVRDNGQKRGVLEHLVDDGDEPPPQYESTIPRGAVGEITPVLLQTCHQTLEQLRDTILALEVHSDERIKNVSRRLRWPFKENEIRDLLVKIGRHKSSFQLAISVDNMYVTQHPQTESRLNPTSGHNYGSCWQEPVICLEV